MARKLASEKMIARSEADVIDFGCGTGLVGEALKQAGFQKISGIACSQGMLDLAEEKNVYKHLTKFYLGG